MTDGAARLRHLEWDACRNARDLGGLPIASGGETRFGSIIRSDTLRQLTAAGWAALELYGVTTIVDLRFRVEIDADAPLDSGPGGMSRTLETAMRAGVRRPASVRVVNASLLGEPDPSLGRHFDRISRAEALPTGSTRAVYLEILRRFPDRIASAVAAIATAEEGGVVVHCHAGKDRTGLVAAFALTIAGVAPEHIAEDYALSEPNLEQPLATWIGDADDADELEHRRRVAAAPQQAMLDVLEAVEREFGGVDGYLISAGATDRTLERLRARLVA